MKGLLWTAFLTLLAVMAVGAQLDRASRRQPELAPFVPGPFRTFAQEGLTMANVRSADPPVALAEAQKLVERSPLPAEHLTLLAIAKERIGEREASARLIQRAAQRGWRDPIAQQAMFDIALAAGDTEEASHRLAALWAMQEEQAPLGELGQRLLAEPKGIEAMSDTLLAGGNWTRSYLRATAESLDDRSAAAIRLALQKGARFDCSASNPLKHAFIKRGLAAEASQLDNCKRRES